MELVFQGFWASMRTMGTLPLVARRRNDDTGGCIHAWHVEFRHCGTGSSDFDRRLEFLKDSEFLGETWDKGMGGMT